MRVTGPLGAARFRYAGAWSAAAEPPTGSTSRCAHRRGPGSTPADDLANFVRKVRAGASSAITQYFYNTDAYFRFIDEAAKLGCTIAVVPGIMPITNYTQLARFSDACGAEIPRWVRRRLESYGDDRESIRAFGLDVVTNLCDRLLNAGAPAATSTR